MVTLYVEIALLTSVTRFLMCSKCVFVRARRVPESDTASLITFEAPGPAHESSLVRVGFRNAALTCARNSCDKHELSCHGTSSSTILCNQQHEYCALFMPGAGRESRGAPVLDSQTDTTALSVGEVSLETSGCSATTTCNQVQLL